MNYFFVSNTALFRGVSEEEIQKMFLCLQFRSRSYQKGESILRCGSVVTEIGLVLSGSVQIENTDLWGKKTILYVADPGEVFAEAYACLPNQPLLVDVTAKENCSVLFVSIASLLNPCEKPCTCHATLIKNLLWIGARKNLALSDRIFDISSKTIRGRIISYFSRVAMQQGSNLITLPFDRQQLADYLGIDRSALSRELGKMREEGLLDFDRSHRSSFVCRLDE